MPSKVVEEFLEQGERSGLFTAAAAQDVLAQWTAVGSLTSADVAAELVAKKLLTPFQAEQLLAGRGQECLIAGRYRLLEKLGEGGMGAVFKAHDTQMDRDVAVKVLPARSVNDADGIARFQREARALAKLSHPNIIQAYDSGEDKGRHFLVMEYVDGASLAAILREQGAVPPTLAADMIYQAALALQHAHSKGLVHRDLKPANLLLAFARPLAGQASAGNSPLPSASQITKTYSPPAALSKGVMKVLDLGLACFLQDQIGDSQVTKEGAGVGTPDYMAPEQFRDALHADARTDIYGLGCTLYHLIGGSVPFPGSSFSEKADAHAKKEPVPLEERCSEVPAGLTFVVLKMMAKHPADRFQTAAEVADALAPYVAGASHSMIMLRQTVRFHAGQLTLRRPSRRKHLLAWVGGLVAAACFLGLFVLAWPSIFPATPADDPKGLPPQTKEPGKKEPEPAKSKVVTIKNGLTVAQDGTGQCKTIGEALEKVKPGQTIRVLDAAKYEEALTLTDHGRHAGLVLEAPRGATLVLPPSAVCGLMIRNVPRVQVHGFRMTGSRQNTYLAAVLGPCPGVMFDGVDFHSALSPAGVGLSIENTLLAPDEAPIVVHNCSFKGLANGILISGLLAGKSHPCRRVSIRQGRFSECEIGIGATGLLGDVHIVGNRIWSCGSNGGIILTKTVQGSKGILIANNSLQDPRNSVHFQEPIAADTQVDIRNNLVLADRGPDLAFNGNDPKQLAGLRIDHNWRRVRLPPKTDPDVHHWLPWSKDTVREDLQVPSSSSSAADFMRPAKNSPLATGGAGGDLPGFVGAVPPEGVEPWNWQWTWDALVERRLTVSKDPKTGGRFRTIAAALKDIKANMTLRVLDAEKYPEPLVIDDAKAHEGLVLEAPQQATLVLAEGTAQSILLQGVAKVRVRGFRFESTMQMPPERAITCFVLVGADCPGLILEELDCKAGVPIAGVVLLSAKLPPDADPIVVKNCTIRVKSEAIVLAGTSQAPVRRALILNNRLQAARGILIDQLVQDVIVAGNLASNCEQAAIQVWNPHSAMRGVLIANNTLFNNVSGLRIWRNGAKDVFAKDQVEIRGNILLASQIGDITYYRQPPGEKLGHIKDCRALLDLWQFGNNFRDLSGGEAPKVMPLAKGDTKLDPAWLVSRIATDPDFLRPKSESPLAKGGARGDLPPYAGALPPKGGPPWDWVETWKAREQKRKK